MARMAHSMSPILDSAFRRERGRSGESASPTDANSRRPQNSSETALSELYSRSHNRNSKADPTFDGSPPKTSKWISQLPGRAFWPMVSAHKIGMRSKGLWSARIQSAHQTAHKSLQNTGLFLYGRSALIAGLTAIAEEPAGTGPARRWRDLQKLSSAVVWIWSIATNVSLAARRATPSSLQIFGIPWGGFRISLLK